MRTDLAWFFCRGFPSLRALLVWEQATSNLADPDWLRSGPVQSLCGVRRLAPSLPIPTSEGKDRRCVLRLQPVKVTAGCGTA